MGNNKIEVGDIIEVEDAWEDEAGYLHDENAEVLSINKKGDMKLKFDRKDITEWLNGAEFNVKDFQDCIVKKGDENG